ncbi:MAG TPA: divalent-cation tolerance protein CutA [Acidobacteriota bacterium]|nr:divalent-cation tolerance protein CutA [Acidobacteriota bacterium]
MNEIIVLSTVDSRDLGKKIANALVEAGDAACVNIIPGMTSIYRWEGKVCNEEECLLVIKSSTEKFEIIRETIKRLHSYQVPEIIAVPATAGDTEYLAWMRASLSTR